MFWSLILAVQVIEVPAVCGLGLSGVRLLIKDDPEVLAADAPRVLIDAPDADVPDALGPDIP